MVALFNVCNPDVKRLTFNYFEKITQIFYTMLLILMFVYFFLRFLNSKKLTLGVQVANNIKISFFVFLHLGYSYYYIIIQLKDPGEKLL